MLISQIETQLKKRWSLPYNWGRKQDDAWDLQTRFIYGIAEFDEVNHRISNLFSEHPNFLELRNYALNRWYNFQSAQAVESLFNTHPIVAKVKNERDREKDFFINGIPFDHKTSVFPTGFGYEIAFAEAHPKELAKWFYINQSAEQRFHLKNRLFLVLHKSDGQHWRLKAELEWINILVYSYLDAFNEQSLIHLKHSKGIVKTDVIFGCR